MSQQKNLKSTSRHGLTFALSGERQPANMNSGGLGRFANCFINSNPIPRLAPVTRTDFTVKVMLSSLPICSSCFAFVWQPRPQFLSFQYGICHVGTNATSSNMAQKVLTWSNNQLNSRCSFHIPCLFFVLYESEFASDIKDVTFMFRLHMIYVENDRS